MAAAASQVSHHIRKNSTSSWHGAEDQLASASNEAQRLEEGHGDNSISKESHDGSVEGHSACRVKENEHLRAFQAAQFLGGVQHSMFRTRIAATDDIAMRRHYAALRVQLFARSHILCTDRLHRENLGTRLEFEAELRVGGWRLFTQLMLFVLLLSAVLMSDNPVTKRGIYTSLQDAFSFDELKQVVDRSEFVSQHMPFIADTAKEYFLLSDQYFVPDTGAVRIVKDAETFPSPRLVQGISVSVQIEGFSFTALVKTNAQFVRGYILRKRIVPVGSGAELACWGWYLGARDGQGLHYGAHDFFSTDSQSPFGIRQEEVLLSNSTGFVADQFTMLTVIVNRTEVTFYENLRRLGTAQMPRHVTDCFNNLEGILVGDTGLTLGQVSFYPKLLTPTVIEEIFIGGGSHDDLSTGSGPGADGQKTAPTLTESIGVQDRTLFFTEQQELDEITSVVQDAGNNTRHLAALLSPSLGMGRIPIDSNITADPANSGLEYRQLLRGPYLMDRGDGNITGTEATFAGERFFSSQDFPRFVGRGVTFTTWFRNTPCPPGQSCGGFVLSAHESKESSARCWSWWLETDGLYWDVKGGNPQFGYPVNTRLSELYTQKFKLTSDTWRHVAIVFNEDNDQVEYFLDGLKIYTGPFGKPVREMDCGPVNVSTGFRWPGYSLGTEIELYDLRMYIGSPLTESQVFNIATALVTPSPSFGGDDQDRAKDWCLYMASPDMVDKPWVDAYGHGCAWYFLHKELYPTVCNYPGASLNCPIACKSQQECFNVEFLAIKKYYAWKSIRRIESRSKNGTICLANNLDKQRVLDQCNEWLPSINTDGLVWQWQNDVEERLEGQHRVNLTECQSLHDAVDETCNFDITEVEKFTTDLKANGGDFTLGFWFKSLGDQSLSSDGRFLLSVHFLSTISPPFSNVMFAPMVSGSKGEVRTRSRCTGAWEPGLVHSEEIEMSLPSQDGEWTFVAITKNNKGAAQGKAEATVATNAAKQTESQGRWNMCLGDEKALFSAIEVNYPILMSPIMMIPQHLPFGMLQDIYYQQAGEMGIRAGPLVASGERQQTKIAIDKVDYVRKSALMATPIIFQERVHPTATCPYEYSTDWIQSQHDKVLDMCTLPFTCSDNVMQNSEATLSCAGSPVLDEREFGLEPQVFENVGFADFLFSITDTQFLFRDGKLISTDSFIDSLTKSVRIILVFFTPQYGMTSVMSVDADLSGPASVTVETNMQHYGIIEGVRLTEYIIVQCMVLIFIFSMVLDTVYTAIKVRRRWQIDNLAPHPATLLLMGVDILSIIMTTCIVIVRLPAKMSSAEAVRDVLSSLDGIKWAGSEVRVLDKKAAFFEAVRDLLQLIENEATVDTFLNMVLIILLIRVIQCTSLHPRLALLTGTILKAMDDFWHSALLIGLIMCSFSGIGTWRFGAEREEFASFLTTMQTLFMMMLGEFLPDWTERYDLQAFVVLFLLIMFLLVLNFLLAIIVEVSAFTPELVRFRQSIHPRQSYMVVLHTTHPL